MASETSSNETVVISGGTGMIGSRVADHLRSLGARVRILTRSPREGDHIGWDPDAGSLDPDSLEGCTGVIHLAGESIHGRWTSARKAKIRDSRVRSTELLAAAVRRMNNPPRVFISASGSSYYPINTGIAYDESGPRGDGFLASVCRDWEGALEALDPTPIRIAVLRLGVVLSKEGGALATLLPIFRKGAGGPAGSGKQHMSWISVRDVASVCGCALKDERYAGPINLCTPQPVTNAEFARTLGRVLERPARLPVPGFALRLRFGRMAEETILADNPVRPAKLQEWGFDYRDPKLEPALRQILESSPDKGG